MISLAILTTGTVLGVGINALRDTILHAKRACVKASMTDGLKFEVENESGKIPIEASQS